MHKRMVVESLKAKFGNHMFLLAYTFRLHSQARTSVPKKGNVDGHMLRSLYKLQPPEASIFENKTTFSEVNQLIEEARRRAKIARSNCGFSSISTEQDNLTLHCPI
jgi:hypothetical protein